MSVEILDEFWRNEFGDTPPIAHRLKFDFENRWFRIHTLPGSKRYPDTNNEFLVILHRHNQVLGELFGNQRNYFLVTPSRSDRLDPVRDAKTQAMGLQKVFWQTVPDDDLDKNAPYYCHLFVDLMIWQKQSADPLLTLIADDELRGVLFVSVQNNFLYHPYDGGADIILQDSLTRDRWKTHFKTWLSAHPKGF